VKWIRTRIDEFELDQMDEINKSLLYPLRCRRSHPPYQALLRKISLSHNTLASVQRKLRITADNNPSQPDSLGNAAQNLQFRLK
jgi:hypothetical protein